MRVAVIGASINPDRYSNKAVRQLKAHDHDVIPVHPLQTEIEGLKTARTLKEVEPDSVHTITMYVGPARSSGMLDELMHVSPKRVIFNPGAENETLRKALAERGVEVVEGCTLVMLRTGRF